MNWKPPKRHFRALSETTSKLLDPILRKRAGLNIELMDNWSHLVGEDVAETTMPIKIIWSRRTCQDDPFQPATLVVACEGYAAMRLTHESGEILQRINAFFGYIAINRIKIEQRSLQNAVKKTVKQPFLNECDRQLVDQMASGIEDDALRQSLCKLGFSVFAEKNMNSNKEFSK